MPLPRFVARTNDLWINPIARRIGPRVPPMMLVHHVGRTTGTPYSTPIWAFRTDGGFVMALTYGPSADWVRNLQAAGEATAIYRKQRLKITEPQVIHGHPGQQPLPWLIQRGLTVMGVRDFLYVTAAPAD